MGHVVAILVNAERTATKSFVRVFGLEKKEPRLKELLHSPRLAKAARDLEDMAGGVRFYQAQAFFKEPGDGDSLWHSDNYACPLDTNNQLTTAWIPMVKVERQMGALAFARGSHQDMSLSFWNDGKPMKKGDSLDEGAGVYNLHHITSRFHVDTWPRLNPGDVTFHAGWTMHASFSNTDEESKVREAATVSYVPDSVRTLPTQNYAPLYAADDYLNGIRQKLYAAKIAPGDSVPESILPRIWPTS